MGLNGIRKGINETLRVAGVIGTLAGSAGAQEPKISPELPRVEKPAIYVTPGIPLPEKYFRIDDFVAAQEETPETRQKLAEELLAFVFEHGVADPDNVEMKEMLFPLKLSNEDVTVRVNIIAGAYKEIKIIIFRGDNTPIALIDSEVTGTPSGHQLPTEEKGVVRPQGFLIQGEHPLANRIYLGILRQLLSKF